MYSSIEKKRWQVLEIVQYCSQNLLFYLFVQETGKKPFVVWRHYCLEGNGYGNKHKWHKGCQAKVVNDMKRIYKYFCMLFIGSILPFLIVELYLRDSVTIGYLALLTTAILMSCVIIESLKGKVVQWLDVRHKDLEDFHWKKEKGGTPTVYYFRNYW
jgi:hypothetical protein